MENNIFVRIRNLYGRTLYHPVCEKAVLFAKLAKTDTLTLETIDKIKALGFVVICEFAENLSKPI